MATTDKKTTREILEENKKFVIETKGPRIAERLGSLEFASNWFGFFDALKSANLLKDSHQGRSTISSLF